MENYNNLSINEIENALGTLTNLLYSSSGGSKHSSLIKQISGFDFIGNSIYMPNVENAGLTFFTRPRLNLSTSSIRNDRVLSLLDSLDPNDVSFAIRCLLDTEFCNRHDIQSIIEKSPLINSYNPFIPILTNNLKTISGWPDVNLETETTEGGYHSESIVYPKGSDDLNRTYNLSATFSDVQGSFILFLFFTWYRYLYLASKGVVSQYPKDIENRRLGFTCSIYRFVLDTSRQFITKWAKATGTFITSVPIGAYFNYDKSNQIMLEGNNLSIPFVVSGKIEYMDAIILQEFNKLVKRFCKNIDNVYLYDKNDKSSYVKASSVDELLDFNHHCLPYINTEDGTNELEWRYSSALFGKLNYYKYVNLFKKVTGKGDYYNKAKVEAVEEGKNPKGGKNVRFKKL